MPVTVTFPGVYVEELFNLSLTVSAGQTSVPIIAAADDEPALQTALRLNTWLDFTSKTTFDPGKRFHRALHAYFVNGGGPCYVVAATKMLEEVPKYDDITLLVSAGRDISEAVNMLCVDGSGLFAVVDGPHGALEGTLWLGGDGGTTIADSEIPKDIASLVEGSHVAAYYPYLQGTYKVTATTDAPASRMPGRNGLKMVTTTEMKGDVPPSAVMAGIYCATDRTRGVWKAPANVAIKGGYTLMHPITDALQGQVNEKGLNMLRHFSNSGVTAWGCRTLQNDNSWRYIPVRRLFDAAQRDIKRAMQFAMFEPNTAYTWRRVKGAIQSYLYKIHQAGGLQGDKPEQAYFVQVGLGSTMSQDDIDNGSMIVRIGMAAARPAEFIILQFTQEMIEV